MASASTLAQVYRRFGEAGHPDASPLYKHVALALSESDEALRAVEAVPPHKRSPAVILAALHDLALAGRAPALAAAYAAADGGAAAAIDTLLRMTGAVTDIAVRRPVRADETGRHAVLYPAIAEAARRAGAKAVGLGVGVAPTIPTLGDRPASGHSIIGLALFGPSAPPAESIARCWSRGHVMAWLADFS